MLSQERGPGVAILCPCKPGATLCWISECWIYRITESQHYSSWKIQTHPAQPVVDPLDQARICGADPHQGTECHIPLFPLTSPFAPPVFLGCFADPHHHPVPQGDPQQRGQRQLRRGTAAEGVAAVPREAAEGEGGEQVQPLSSHSTHSTPPHGSWAWNKLSEHPARAQEKR